MTTSAGFSKQTQHSDCPSVLDLSRFTSTGFRGAEHFRQTCFTEQQTGEQKREKKKWGVLKKKIIKFGLVPTRLPKFSSEHDGQFLQ
jgi:hypothetical protein